MSWPPPPDVGWQVVLVEVVPAVTQRDAEELFRARMTIGCGSTSPVARAVRRPLRSA